MADTITVGSRAHAAFVITEPLPEEFKDRPGDAPALKSVTINGERHESVMGGVGITKGVDAKLFHDWLDGQKKANAPIADKVFEMSADEADKPAEMSFGHQPALDALAADAENTAKAAEGSTVTAPGPVSSADMAAKSDTPNDDTPRGDPVLSGPATQTPATAKIAPAAKA